MRPMTALRLAWIVPVMAAVLLPLNAAASTPHVEQADLNGDINNIMSAYIQSAVTRAERDVAVVERRALQRATRRQPCRRNQWRRDR